MKPLADDEILRLYVDGLSLRELHCLTGLSYRVLRKKILAAGVMRTQQQGIALNYRLGKRKNTDWRPPERPAGYFYGRVARGEGHGNAKLDAQKVRYILGSPKTASQLAVELGVSKYTVLDVRRRKTWAHIK